MIYRLLLAILVGQVSCRTREPESDPSATPDNRHIIGPGIPYGSGTVPTEESLEDFGIRRQYAWSVVENITSLRGIGSNVQKDFRLPLFQTWYDVDEFKTMLRQLYIGLGKDGRQQKVPICPQQIAGIFKEHANRDLNIFGWSPEKMERRLGQLQGQQDVQGVSGRGLTLFSPAVLAHFFNNMREVVNCKDKVILDKISATTDLEKGFHTPCFTSEFPSATIALNSRDSAYCTSKFGPNSGTAAVGASFAIKTSWHRTNSGSLAVFESDADGLLRAINKGEFLPSQQIDPMQLSDNDIFSIKIHSGVGQGAEEFKYDLTGIHMTVKDSEHWTWVSLWWSPDGMKDFGSDKPAALQQGPWRNYKMCVVTNFTDKKFSLSPEYASAFPDLARSLRVAYNRSRPYTWCSNPYIERGAGNARTNCIGCHQHAGTGVFPDKIFRNMSDTGEFPFNGKGQERSNFLADYLWAFDSSPDFFRAEIFNAMSEIDQADRDASINQSTPDDE